MEVELSAGKPHPAHPLGCWCPAGQVLDSEGRCVGPQQCPCLQDDTWYQPGQRIRANCQLCTCQDGRPQRCRPDPACSGEAPPLALPWGALIPSQATQLGPQPSSGT